MSLSPGTHLGRFEIRQPLGAGGMGEVYVAWDHDLEREVAIKVLRHGAAETADRVRRFVQEARAASALNHPNVAHVYEIGSQEPKRAVIYEGPHVPSKELYLRESQKWFDETLGNVGS